jgi:alpha-ribazole phosphatase
LAKILLVRHAQIKLDEKDDRFWGATDIPLSDPGIRQAEKLRDRLAEENIDVIYTSNLSRSRDTAGIIASVHKCKIAVREEINEVNFGFIEGLTYGEIQDLYPDLADVLSDFGTIVRFPGGESFEDLDKRVKTFVNSLDSHHTENTVLIVSHGGPLPLIICHLLEIGTEHWRKIWLEPASLSIIYSFPHGARLNLLNDISHLK